MDKYKCISEQEIKDLWVLYQEALDHINSICDWTLEERFHKSLELLNGKRLSKDVPVREL